MTTRFPGVRLHQFSHFSDMRLFSPRCRRETRLTPVFRLSRWPFGCCEFLTRTDYLGQVQKQTFVLPERAFAMHTVCSETIILISAAHLLYNAILYELPVNLAWWAGEDSNLRCFSVGDLQSLVFAARHTDPKPVNGNRTHKISFCRRTPYHSGITGCKKSRTPIVDEGALAGPPPLMRRFPMRLRRVCQFRHP